MNRIRTYLDSKDHSENNYLAQGYMLECAGLYCRAMTDFLDLSKDMHFESEGLASFHDYAALYCQNEDFTSLTSAVSHLQEAFAKLTYCMQLCDGTIRVRDYDEQPDYTAKIKKDFEKFSCEDDKDYRHELKEDIYADHIEIAVLDMLAKVYPDEFRSLCEFCDTYVHFDDHVISLFADEIHFYLGWISYIRPLRQAMLPFCFPVISDDPAHLYASDFYDLALAQQKGADTVTNDFHLDDPERLLVVTGPNQGGKTTFLRSAGQAQLMAQCGMFIGAESASIPIRSGIFTHFKKEEDSSMTSGKLDEELVRMDHIIPELKRDSMILFNESFSATNEREGSEICHQITSALIKNNIEVFSVTHMYPYAIYYKDYTETQYLHAERDDNGVRSFRLTEGKPLLTAFGGDLYKEIFDDDISQNIS